MLRHVLILGLALIAWRTRAEGLSPDRLGVVYNLNDRSSTNVAKYYAAKRKIPVDNLIGLAVPDRSTLSRAELRKLRAVLLLRLPSNVQSLLLVWSRPYAVECMSVTTAFAAGYQADFCEPGCGHTISSPLFDTAGWLPADTTGWLPAMLLPSADEVLARAVVDRGVGADGTEPNGNVYLVRTQDSVRNVRSTRYADTEALLSNRLRLVEIATPVKAPLTNILAYFTGVSRVEELPLLSFRRGAVADHLTSAGGQLEGSSQMSALEWLRRGATGSYGSVSEPCNQLAKFPNPAVFLDHYRGGDTLLEAYWKSVASPGQGLFIGEPLSRPFRVHY
jgi:uncharacterized protein (TIGR03790 family)